MSRLWPQTLVGRTLLVLLLGFVVSHALSMAIYWGDRSSALDTARGEHVAEILEEALETLDKLPPEQRPEAARSFSGYGVRVVWMPDSILPEGGDGYWRLRRLRGELADRLGDIDTERVRVAIKFPNEYQERDFPRRRHWRDHVHRHGPGFKHRKFRRPAHCLSLIHI